MGIRSEDKQYLSALFIYLITSLELLLYFPFSTENVDIHGSQVLIASVTDLNSDRLNDFCGCWIKQSMINIEQMVYIKKITILFSIF